MKRNEAIQKMNKYGKEKTPFLFIIDFLQEKPQILPLDKVDVSKIEFKLPSISLENKQLTANSYVFIENNGYSHNSYVSQFKKVNSHIRRGDSFLVNLTCKTSIALNTDLKTLYNTAKAKYKLRYKNEFVVFSPETFVKIENGNIFSYPMKGTIDANIPKAEELILNSAKEKAEHYTIVDLIRNDLSMVAKNVEVTKFRYIDKLSTNSGSLLQVSSEIKGELAENYNAEIGDIIFNLLPAGSISGAPKNKTVDIILNTETYDRGYYTGIFGVFDGVNLDSAVMIRFIEKTDDGYVYKSGGGITAFSNAEDEYNEMLKKIYVPIN